MWLMVRKMGRLKQIVERAYREGKVKVGIVLRPTEVNMLMFLGRKWSTDNVSYIVRRCIAVTYKLVVEAQ